MKLKDFKKLIDKVSKFAGTTNPNIDFYMGEKTELIISKIDQGNIIPDVHVTLKRIKR